MDGLEAKVWRRYGHLRIYVSRDGTGIGWYDVRTGRHELTVPDLAAPFWNAVRTECRTLGEPAPPAPGTRPPDGTPTTDRARPESAPQPPTTPTHNAHPPPTSTGHTPPTGTERTPTADGGLTPAAGAGHPPVAGARFAQAAEEPELDLALNRPGGAAQARADELRDWRTRLAALVGARTQARDFAVGAKAERVIGGRLDKWARKHGWHVLHAVPVGRRGADIDHVLIGPFGVVTVNTKSTRGKVWVADNGIMVGGTKVDYLRNSRHEAQRARKLLADACGRHVPVQAAVVFVGAKGFTVRNGGPHDVAVLRDVRAFRRWLRRCGNVLSPEQVAEVHAAARRPKTWRP
ncbi:nuclease-related domain-containing protein [Actinomadura montaniterrae]|uniref:NERD domain-containing protein n=1 Tax=Actinomadura montaniterrae TaxID=1803903 RepID=A0A6L3VC32_9ACTN|nr:nuclease-related domain-containing protein [Actinomadura montaniterrae]KAB2354228.1 hypothetical protein F9B16_48995 [Actinomadura montaniterrae]